MLLRVFVQTPLPRDPKTSNPREKCGLSEITQEIVLAALGRTDLFGQAGFQGGTCLRIFHSLNRFSEDMDFALDAPDEGFQLNPYLYRISEELTAYGYEFEIVDRSKASTHIQQAFLKDESVACVMSSQGRRKIALELSSLARRDFVSIAGTM